MAPRHMEDEPQPRSWSGPIEKLGEDERRSLVDSMSAPPARPRIRIDDALQNDWFEIWYQPKIDLKRKCLAGAEALARIRHPDLGVLLPGSFLPDITEGSVERLTEHALIATLRNWSTFDAAGFNLHLAINLPVGVLVRLPITELVEQHRPSSNRWPGIILEITEDQIVRDIALAQKIATKLRASGIKISIDDFGAGYSSFSSLRDLPFAELKLHESFVKDCATDATNAAICQTAVDLAHRFGSAAVAEGIESQTDLQALMVMGCDFGQGFLIAPPMPQERFLELLNQRLNKTRPQTVPAAHDGEAHTAQPPAVGQVA
jgi:EAL domain-containing protein (putative c-di-GMP-specific phosphodiesterase class I)